jgi:thiol-disulfide isomerase/thioredoxin
MDSVSSALTRVRLQVLVVALSALSVVWTPSSRAANAPTSITVLDSLTGDSTVVEGKVVYVDFWASWCVPCRRSFPWMMELRRKYEDQGLQIVTVNVDRDRAAAAKFLEAIHGTLPVVYDPAGKLAKLYDLQVMPTSFIYGRDGTLRKTQAGFHPAETGTVESLVRSLLEEKSTK